MNLRLRFVLLHTLLVSLILGTAFLLIYLIYSNTREDDFSKRLWAQAITSYKNFDTAWQPTAFEAALVDNASAGALANPSIAIINSKGKLATEKIGNKDIAWDTTLLVSIKRHGHQRQLCNC